MKKIILFILWLPIVLTFGTLWVVFGMIYRYIALWQLSDSYKKKHKEYHTSDGEFNSFNFVLANEIGGDKGRREMWKR